jgi:hypothetical protein
MDSPITTVKSALNLSFLLKLLAGILLVGLVLGYLGLTNWIINPYGALKAKFPSLPNPLGSS